MSSVCNCQIYEIVVGINLLDATEDITSASLANLSKGRSSKRTSSLRSGRPSKAQVWLSTNIYA